MPTASYFPNRAFISYSHRDAAWCAWLHRGLERYRIPADIAGRITDAGPVPRHLRPIFRDRSDFSAGPLQAQTIDALKNSQFLIVISSPNAAVSTYVDEEIRLFQNFGGGDRILTLIVSGRPPECFPPSLRNHEMQDGVTTADGVGADVVVDGKREALVKIASRLIGVPYGVMWPRDVKARRLQMAGYATTAIVAIAAVFGVGTTFVMHRDVVTIGERAAATAQKQQEELKRLVIDASGGGAPSVKAVAELRTLLRPGNPEIDAISAEQLPKLVEKIIADLQKPAARAEDFTGAIRRALEQAQRQTAKLSFVDAAATLDEALTKAEADDQDRAHGKAALLAERGRVAGLQLRYREAAGFYSRAAAAVAFNAQAAWYYTIEAANALRSQGDEFGDKAALGDAIRTLRTALTLTSQGIFPFYWAETQNILGTTLWILGKRERSTQWLEESVSVFHTALKVRTRDHVPLDWAATQVNLGNTLVTLSDREGGARLGEAVAAYRNALEEFPRDRQPFEWAATQNNLGNALRILGERESGTQRLEEAVVAFHAALEEWSRERFPLEWASAQTNLGDALTALGEREHGTQRLEDAAAILRAALEVRTRERVPLLWAVTQTSLGRTLTALGKRESGTQRLEEAISFCRAALEEETRERAPLDWANTQNALGAALSYLGERESWMQRLKESVVAYRAALEELTRNRVPLDWAMTQNNLGVALKKLGERETGTQQLEEAVTTFRVALEEWTPERTPLYWAMLQNNLGDGLLALGERENSTRRLEEAVTAYRAALKEWTRSREPENWALVENNLGDGLLALGKREGGTHRLEEAVAAYHATLDGWTRDRAPTSWAVSLGKMGVVQEIIAHRTGDVRLARQAVEEIETAHGILLANDRPSAAYFERQLAKTRALVGMLEDLASRR